MTLADLRHATGADVRRAARSGELTGPTPGLALGYGLAAVGAAITVLAATGGSVPLLFVGLFLFASFALLPVFAAYRALRAALAADPDRARLGASLIACMLGTLLMLFDASLVLGYEKMFYVLAGLATAYAHMRVDELNSRHAPVSAAGY